jgi:hypothetical protein
MNNFHLKNIISAALVICSFASPIMIYADEQTEDVINLMTTVERKMKNLESYGGNPSLKSDMEALKGYMEEAKEDLKKGEAELAFYKVSLAMSYLKKIEARKELLTTEGMMNGDGNQGDLKK